MLYLYRDNSWKWPKRLYDWNSLYLVNLCRTVTLYRLRDQDILCGCNSVLLLTMTSIHKTQRWAKLRGRRQYDKCIVYRTELMETPETWNSELHVINFIETLLSKDISHLASKINYAAWLKDIAYTQLFYVTSTLNQLSVQLKQSTQATSVT